VFAVFFLNDPSTTEIYTLSLHDALPIFGADLGVPRTGEAAAAGLLAREDVIIDRPFGARHLIEHLDAIAVGVAQIDAERDAVIRSEEHTSELQSLAYLVCRLLLEKKKKK